MVYFDNAATTPVPKAVADAMYEVLTAHFGNPSSQYPIGVEMKKAVEGWRAVIAGALGCPAERLYFTSCGTESDNWAIQAALWQNRHRGRHIITTAVEHSAVLEPCKLLAQQGYEVTYLKPGRDGNVTAEQVADALREDTALVSVMLVNNETGAYFPRRTSLPCCGRRAPLPLHCDAVPGLFEGPLRPGGLGRRPDEPVRSQGRRAQGRGRAVHRSPGAEPPPPAARRRTGARRALRHRGHGPDRRALPRRWCCGWPIMTPSWPTWPG